MGIKDFLRPLLTLLLLASVTFSLSAQGFYLHGIVTNTKMEPMPYVNVQVKGSASGTTTDINGKYKLFLYNGQYEVAFSFIGYKTQSMPVVINHSDYKLNMILTEDTLSMRTIVVTTKKTDISTQIIRKVIENASRYESVPGGYSANLYIKATEEFVNIEPKNKKQIKNDSSAIKSLNMAEIDLTLYHYPPDKYKEVRNAVKKRGSTAGLFYLTTTNGYVNFYQNLVKIPALSQTPFLSPFCYSGLIGYRYKMEKIFFEKGKKYYRIKILPGKLGNALVTGEAVIEDSTWNIVDIDFTLPKYHLAEYDYFNIKQHYEWFGDSLCLLTKAQFSYEAKMGKAKSLGKTIVYYSDYVIAPELNKKFFKNELSVTTEEAYQKDTSFWEKVRKEPLTEKELKFIRYSDSIKAAHSKKEYLDSIDKDFNKLTVKKLFLMGQGYVNRDKEKVVWFKPLVFAYEPVNVGGHRVSYWLSYSKQFKSKRYFDINPDISYGFRNKDLKGSISATLLYNPFKRAVLNVAVSRSFGMINPEDAWVNLFRRSNFYEQEYLSVWHRIELLNGLYITNQVTIENQESIADFNFSSEGDNLFKDNTAKDFEKFKGVYSTIRLSYTPFQKYLREPRQKVVLGSKFPTFSISWEKAIPAVLESVADFDYVEFTISQQFELGLVGVSNFYFNTGKFITSSNLQFVDYKFQNRGHPFLYSNPMRTFQALDSTFPVFKQYYEMHYLHRFNGAVFNKIPLFKKLQLMEVAGGGFLFAPERKLNYIEAFVGIEKIIRLWKERFKLGVYVVGAESNSFRQKFQIKFSLEYYNRQTNTWRY